MADFCQECSIRMFGEDFGDLAGLVEPGETSWVLCEGCGFILVDETGKCVGFPKVDEESDDEE